MCLLCQVGLSVKFSNAYSQVGGLVYFSSHLIVLIDREKLLLVKLASSTGVFLH